jgi:hypothetical protein
MAIRQTRLFVPSSEPDEGWAETAAGRVIKPITKEYRQSLSWFWFSRYVSDGPDSGDCDFDAIPESHKQRLSQGGLPHHRSLRFRFDISDDQQRNFEQRLRELRTQGNYAISDIRDYTSWLEDTGGHRFLGSENRQPGRAEQRSRLVLSFYQVTSQLVLDALVGPDSDGRYLPEKNDHPQNSLGSTFESLHHLFCNITQPPLAVHLYVRFGVGTNWMSPVEVSPRIDVPVRF